MQTLRVTRAFSLDSSQQDATGIWDKKVDLLQIPAKPDGGCRAKAQLCDDLVPRIEDLAQSDGIELFGFIANESLLLELFLLREDGEAVTRKGARLNRHHPCGAGHPRLIKSPGESRSNHVVPGHDWRPGL
jgi:hypothetical protein